MEPSFIQKQISQLLSPASALVWWVTECHLHVLYLESNQDRLSQFVPMQGELASNTSWKVPSGVPPLVSFMRGTVSSRRDEYTPGAALPGHTGFPDASRVGGIHH